MCTKSLANYIEVTDWGIKALKSQLRRVKDVYETDIKPVVEGTSEDMEIPKHELEPLLSYYNALTTALQVAIDDYFDSEEDDDNDDDDE